MFWTLEFWIYLGFGDWNLGFWRGHLTTKLIDSTRKEEGQE
jgi:hypothetical protein